MLTATRGMSERLACKAVGLARSTYRRLPLAQTPADPDAEMRAWLRAHAIKHPCHGFRRAWAALRYDERREVNKKKVHRLWREEGLQVRVRSPRKRAGVSSILSIDADAPNVVWAIDFQFDSTVDGKAIKIATFIDEHTRASLLHVVERSITAERIVTELQAVFAATGGTTRIRLPPASPSRCDRIGGGGLPTSSRTHSALRRTQRRSKIDPFSTSTRGHFSGDADRTS